MLDDDWRVPPYAPHRQLVLASASKARLKVLTDAGIDVRVVVSGVGEDHDSADTEGAVLALAERKASAVAGGLGHGVVLGCDSMLDVDGAALGKPQTAEKAAEIWSVVSGRSAVLHTGHCLIDVQGARTISRLSSTTVHFGEPTPEELSAYIATGEPLELAGACSLEGLGAPFIEGVEGSPSNVIGVSLPLLRSMLGELGMQLTDFWLERDR